uniref:Uncharacterized protein n=1 Tax=viral metagenome TaxID=1070528 RepID=A0A6C0D0U0_9ZZZZ
MSTLATFVSIFLILVISFINVFLYLLNEKFLISLLVLDMTLCLYMYTSYNMTSSSPSLPPHIIHIIPIMIVLYIGYMGYITWLDEYDPQTLVTHSNMYWIYLPVIYFGLFMMILFLWKLLKHRSDVNKEDFIKGLPRTVSSPTKSIKPTTTSNKSLLADFNEQV